MKRLISLTMAAACALSLAVPAFAAKTDVDNSGNVIIGSADTEKVEEAINSDVQGFVGMKEVAVPEVAAVKRNADGKVVWTKPSTDLKLSIGGTELVVDKNEATTLVAQVKKMADKIDKVDGYEAQIIYYGTPEWWAANGGVVNTYIPLSENDIKNGYVELRAYQSPTSVDSSTVGDFQGDISKLTLNDLFLGWNTEKEDVRAFFEPDVANDYNGVLPNETIYFVIRDRFYKPSEIEFDLSKVEGSKYIKSIKDTQKHFSKKDLVAIDNRSITLPKGRYRVLEVKLKENMTADEYKLLFDLRVKCKKEDFQGWQKGETKKFEDMGETWVRNDEFVGDSDWAAGQGGIMIKPQKNEDNEILWYDENRDIAKVEFYADSDTDKFFVKLSTKWNNEWYSDMFRNTDAFIFNFVGAPKISATSRATLTIYNPFVNDDEELEVDLDELKVYKVLDTAALAATTEEAIAEAIADGRIEDVTNLFTAGENEDGDQVLTTRTRDLGTYIVTTATPADLVDDVVVDSTNNGKVNPGTGR